MLQKLAKNTSIDVMNTVWKSKHFQNGHMICAWAKQSTVVKADFWFTIASTTVADNQSHQIW